MKGTDIVRAATRCREHIIGRAPYTLSAERAGPKELLRFLTASGPDEWAARHLLWMCDEIERLVATDRLDKASRWLGFVQGSLWARGYCSIESLKDDNRGTE